MIIVPVVEYIQQPPVVQHLIDIPAGGDSSWLSAWSSGASRVDLSSLGIDGGRSEVKTLPLAGGGTRVILTSLGGAELSSLSAAAVEGKMPLLFTGRHGSFIGLGDAKSLSQSALASLSGGGLSAGAELGGGLRFLGNSLLSAGRGGEARLDLDKDIKGWLRSFLAAQGIAPASVAAAAVGKPLYMAGPGGALRAPWDGRVDTSLLSGVYGNPFPWAFPPGSSFGLYPRRRTQRQ